jgi:hypothetical protein
MMDAIKELRRLLDGYEKQISEQSGEFYHARAIVEKLRSFMSFGRLLELVEAEVKGMLVVLPCGLGETVYRICSCKDIPTQLDGSMYGPDGGYGTATGYYCPYEDNCPHNTDDCDKAKDKEAIFEDSVTMIGLSIEEDDFICFGNTPSCSLTDFGRSVFLTETEAAAALAAKEGAE